MTTYCLLFGPDFYPDSWYGEFPQWVQYPQSALSLKQHNNVSNVLETGQERTKVTVDNQEEVAYALSIGTKINDLG